MISLRPERTVEEAAAGEPFWLDLEPEPIYGVLHTPAPETRARVAALILPTFGWDSDTSYRPRRDWATKLAEAGVAVARIDFPGTENSVGSALAPNRVESWIDATGQAARWLRERSGCDRLVAVAIGLGGMIAYRAVAANAPIDDLILWGTRASGRAYMREQRAYAAIAVGEIGDAREDARADGAIGIGGHIMSGDTADAVSAINLTEVPLPHAALRRVLLVGRDAHGADEKLRRHLEESGAAVTVLEATDYYRLVAPPDFYLTPTKTISASIEWLLDPRSASLEPIEHATTSALPEPRESIEFEYDGIRIRESVSELRTPAGRLIGIISEPTESKPAPYCLVVVNAGALRHTGPNRIFVEIARRAAASGVPAARFDLPGLGDSDGRWVKGFERTVQDDAYELAELRAIFDHLQELNIADRFVAGGLCMGGYLPIRAVLEDDRLIGAISVNPPVLKWAEEQRQKLARQLAVLSDDPAAADAKRVADKPPPPLHSIVDRLGRIQVSLERVARLRLARIELLWRLEHRAGLADAARTLDQLGQTGAQLLLLISENDERELVLRMLSQPKLAAKLQQLPNIQFERLPTRDHNLRPLWAQEMLFNRIALALHDFRSLAEALVTPSRTPGAAIAEPLSED